MELVAQYLVGSPLGVIRIFEDRCMWSHTRIRHWVWWYPQFSMGLPLDFAPTDLVDREQTVQLVRDRFPDIKPIEDLEALAGYILYAEERERGGLRVSLGPSDEGKRWSIRADEVPLGSELDEGAASFFFFWKGPEAVQRKELVKL